MREVTDPVLLARLKAYEEQKKSSSNSDNFREVRDPELLKKLHAYEEQKKQSSEKPSVSSDIINSLSNAPSAIFDFASNLPRQIVESTGQIATNPVRAAENVGAGLLEGLKGGANIPSNIARYMQTRGIGNENEENASLRDLIAKAHIPDTGLEKAILGENQKGDEFLRSLGSFAPYARLGGATKGLAGLARRAGSTAAYATGQEEDPLRAALMGLGAEGAVRGIQRGAKRSTFLPSSPLTNQELFESVQNTKGTETSLGNVIQNPFLTEQFENTIAHLPFSGATQSMQRTGSEIIRRGENLINQFKGEEEVPDIGERLHGALNSAYQDTRNAKNEKFKLLNEAAEKEGIRTNRSNLIETAKEKLSDIEKDPHRAGLIDTKVKSVLNNIVNLGNQGAEEFGDLLKGKSKLKFTESELSKALGKKTPTEYSLQDTDLLRGDLGQLANDAYTKGEGSLSNLYKSLKDAATQDIRKAIDEADMPNLNKLRDEAMEFYQKNYTPFKDKEIKKFTLQGGDPDVLMQSFMKNSKLSDRGNLLSKLTSKLSGLDKNLLAHSYFSNAIEEGQLSPAKLGTLYKNLGQKQKNALLSKEMQEQLGDYRKLVKKNERAIDVARNPKTGYTGLSQIPWKIIGSAATLGGIPGGTLGALGGALIPGLIARPLTKALTNPSMREILVKHMIKAREKESVPNRNIAPFVQALMQVSSQGRDDMNNRGIENGVR